MSIRQSTPIPEEDIALLAAQIEDLVLNTKHGGPAAPGPGATGNLSDTDLLSPMISADEIWQKAPALARLNADTEIAVAAVRGRILRRSAVEQFERSGCVGENRRGLLEYLGGEWCAEDRDTQSRAGFVVLSENRDRRVVYKQIIEANGLGSSSMGRIREIFAEQIHNKAWAGTPLETPDGGWKRR
jgi:uncharacterized protein YdbL (DUF1318 family)